MLVLMLPRVSSRVSGFPVASLCLWGKLQNLFFSKVSKQVVMSFVWQARHFDIPTCLITCRRSFCVAGAVLLRRFLKMCSSFRDSRGMLMISVVVFRGRRSTSDMPHCVLYTPHSTLYTPHVSTLRTLHSTLCTPHSTLYTPHSTLYTLHSALYTPHSPHYTLHSTLYTPHCTLHTLHFALHTLHSTLYTPHSTFYTLHFTLYTPHSAL